MLSEFEGRSGKRETSTRWIDCCSLRADSFSSRCRTKPRLSLSANKKSSRKSFRWRSWTPSSSGKSSHLTSSSNLLSSSLTAFPSRSFARIRDRRKLVFYFVASTRIDFRELVRELFRHFKTR